MQDEILEQILSEIKGIKSDVSELKTDVAALKQGQQRIETKLDAAYQMIVENSEEITEIKTRLNKHATVMGALTKEVLS